MSDVKAKPDAPALRGLAPGQSFEISGANVRTIIAARQLRDAHFWPAMSEAAWSLLLELFANGLEGERRDAAGLSAATGLPLGSTLHWIDWLAGRGMVLCNPGIGDAQSARVGLTPAGAERMRAYLLEALKLSGWVQ